MVVINGDSYAKRCKTELSNAFPVPTISGSFGGEEVSIKMLPNILNISSSQETV